MKNSSHTRIPRISQALLASLILWSQALAAQEADPSPAASSPEASPTEEAAAKAIPVDARDESHPKAERIEVTGSRIKRSDVESSSTATVITHEEILRSGVSNLGELIRNSSSQTVGNFSGSSSYVRAGAQTASLFGMGPGRTLVLIDGERLPKDASLGGTNLSTIPLAMIERVEYLTGSRSAVYGSDAVAGVMNIITRKDLEGTVVSGNIRVPQHPGGNKIGLDLSQGVSLGDKGHLLVSGGYEREQRLLTKNRDFGFGEGKFANGTSAAKAGSFSYRVTPAGSTTAGPWTPSANCELTSDLRGPLDPDRGLFCVGNSRDASHAELFGSSERGFFATRGEYEWTSDTHLHTWLSYTQNVARGNSGNYFSGTNYLNSRGQTISGDLANSLNIGINAPADSSVEFRKLDELAPDRVNRNKDQAYGAIIGLDTQLGAQWTGNATLSHFVTENHRIVWNVIDRVNYARIMHGISFDPVTGIQNPRVTPTYIIADPNRNPALIGDMTDTMNSAEKNTITGLTLDAGRDLFELPGGPLSINVGIDMRVETYLQTPDAADQEFFQNQPRFTGTEAVRGKGDRTVNSIYAELLAPVWKELNFDAAVRFDNYSDFGDSTNYSLGGKWDATSFLSLRSTMGTSYRAPELNYVHKEGGGGYVSIRDEAWCAYQEADGNPCVAGQTHSIYSDSPGNKNLNPEKGSTYTIGLLFEPAQDLYFSADYAGFKITDEFSQRPVQDIVDDHFAGRDTGDNKVLIEPTNSYVTSVSRPITNIGWSTTYILKLAGGVKWTLFDTKFEYRTDSTRTLSAKSLRADGSVKQYNGIEGNPRWRWNNALTTTLGPVDWTIATMTIAKQEPDPENGETYADYYYNDQVDEFTQYNTSVLWRYMSGASLSIGVNNIMDKLGGLYRTGNFTGGKTSNSGLYGSSYYGRAYFANITQQF